MESGSLITPQNRNYDIEDTKVSIRYDSDLIVDIECFSHCNLYQDMIIILSRLFMSMIG